MRFLSRAKSHSYFSQHINWFVRVVVPRIVVSYWESCGLTRFLGKDAHEVVWWKWRADPRG